MRTEMGVLMNVLVCGVLKTDCLVVEAYSLTSHLSFQVMEVNCLIIKHVIATCNFPANKHVQCKLKTYGNVHSKLKTVLISITQYPCTHSKYNYNLTCCQS